MNKLDVLIINPGGKVNEYQGLFTTGLTAVHTPIDAGLLAQFLLNHKRSVQILDANALNLSPKETAEKVKEEKPLLAVVFAESNQVNASTQSMTAAGAICTAISESAPETKVLISGHHPAALPERTLKEEKVNFVASSEPYFTVLGLVEALSLTENPNLSKVPGLWYWQDSVATHTPAAPLIKQENLDAELGGLDWMELLPPIDKYYRAHNWQDFRKGQRTPYVVLQTTFGCLFRCHFCMIQTKFRAGEAASGLHGNSYRMLSPRAIVDQMEYVLNKYGGPLFVRIYDEMFVLKDEHVRGVCEEIIRRGLGPNLKIWAYARVNTVKDWMLDLLKRAGFEILAFGIESGSEKVRTANAKVFSQDKIKEILGKVRAAGMYDLDNFIIGLPDEDEETVKETLRLATELNPFFINFFAAMAYPGSPLYEDALREGWKLPPSWNAYAQHSYDSFPLRSKHLTNAQVLKARDDTWKAYFERPAYLEMMIREFGPQARQEVEKMTSVKLKRKLLGD